MALSPTGKRISNLRDLDLDEAALEPGQELNIQPDQPSGPRPENPDLPQGTPQHIAQAGRRISPLVSGRPSRPQRGLQVVSSIPPMVPRQQPGIARVAARVGAPALPPPPAKKRNAIGALVVQLGRYGDIINLLPLMAEEARLVGHPIQMMVSKDFVSVLDGVSYVTPITFAGPYTDLDRAFKWALTLDPDARCSQVFTPGKDFPRKEDSFARESWKRLGASGRWEQVPLVFDQRSREREEALVELFDFSKPLVLVNVNAKSYPFPHTDRVVDGLYAHSAANDYNVLDISNLKCDRIYDLLGVFDRAQLLVTADTATQHLACASSIPVIAFRVSEPWFGSPKRANHILNRRYSDIDMLEVQAAVMGAIKPHTAKVVHIYPSREITPTSHEPGEQTADRIIMARDTWENQGTEILAAHETQMLRNSVDVLKDTRATSYMVDILETGLKQLKNPDEILIFTNSDVGLSDTAIRDVRMLCKQKGACYGYRFDHEKIDRPLDHLDTVSAKCRGGLDIFAFTKGWFSRHARKLPDMLLGRSGWDLAYRDVVRKTGGGELYGAIWHEDHESWWKDNFQTPGNEYNTKLLKRYKTMNDMTRPYDK